MRKRKKYKKTGCSCMEKRMGKSEKPWDTIKRYRRNIIHAYQRIRYGYCDRDVWSIDWWFLRVMPGMLRDLQKTAHGYPSELENAPVEASYVQAVAESKTEAGAKAWDDILKRMAYLLTEADEETCRRKNRYEKEYDRCNAEFESKYGEWGRKLLTPKEKEREKKCNGFIVHSMDGLPEYQDICSKYRAEEKAIWEYRDRCKNEGLDLFKKWFWSLWD